MTRIAKFLLPLLFIAAVALGYRAGYRQALALGRAELAQRLAGEREAYVEQLRVENSRFREEARRAFLTDFALQKERNFYAQEKQRLLDRINALVPGSCLLGPAAVGLWNEAIGAGAKALSPAAHPAGPDANAGRARASGTGYAGRRQ